jgi:hypothetical protein
LCKEVAVKPAWLNVLTLFLGYAIAFLSQRLPSIRGRNDIAKDLVAVFCIRIITPAFMKITFNQCG